MGKWYVIISAGIAGMFGLYGFSALSAYMDLAERQEAINRHVVDTSQTWDALEPIRQKWIRTFKPTTGVDDRFTVFELIDLDNTRLTYSSELLIDGGRKNVEYEGVAIGLVEACVKTSPSGIVATSHTLSEMLNDIRHLEKRKNITFSSISIQDKAGKKTIAFDEICVLLRGEDQF